MTWKLCVITLCAWKHDLAIICAWKYYLMIQFEVQIVFIEHHWIHLSDLLTKLFVSKSDIWVQWTALRVKNNVQHFDFIFPSANFWHFIFSHWIWETAIISAALSLEIWRVICAISHFVKEIPKEFSQINDFQPFLFNFKMLGHTFVFIDLSSQFTVT